MHHGRQYLFNCFCRGSSHLSRSTSSPGRHGAQRAGLDFQAPADHLRHQKRAPTRCTVPAVITGGRILMINILETWPPTAPATVCRRAVPHALAGREGGRNRPALGVDQHQAPVTGVQLRRRLFPPSGVGTATACGSRAEETRACRIDLRSAARMWGGAGKCRCRLSNSKVAFEAAGDFGHCRRIGSGGARRAAAYASQEPLEPPAGGPFASPPSCAYLKASGGSRKDTGGRGGSGPGEAEAAGPVRPDQETVRRPREAESVTPQVRRRVAPRPLGDQEA
jgi:hypothetical protein